MIILASTSDLIRVITSHAAQIECHASWVDLNGTTVTPGRTNTIITTAATTTVVGSPTASTVRNLKHLNITNDHASQSCSVTVEHSDGTTIIKLMQFVLLPGENMILNEEGRWAHRDAQGADVTGALGGFASVPAYGLFAKADPTIVVFTKTADGAASIKAGTKVDVAGTLVQFASATAFTMPTLAAGTDYAVWVKDDGTIQASSSHTSAPGAGNWRKIGGFHYAPGGNAAAQAGGDTTPAINAYSFWDLKFRPACADPRGMTLVADSFWSDIYLLGVDHLSNGTSKYNVTIADGSSPPKIPTKFGGDGTSAYASMNLLVANEVLKSWGKRSPTYEEFAALAYGTTEASSVGPDQGSTVLNAAYTSKWGCVQSSGCMWVWGGEFGGGAAGAPWTANTGGRGSTYQMENAVLFGGGWDDTSIAGSRASGWRFSPTFSAPNIGARGVCDHLILD